MTLIQTGKHISLLSHVRIEELKLQPKCKLKQKLKINMKISQKQNI